MGPGCTRLQPETAASPALAAPSARRPERPVPRIRIGPALPDRKSLDAEIARLRDLGVSELRSRWHKGEAENTGKADMAARFMSVRQLVAAAMVGRRRRFQG